jgi:hypothetical protein
MPRAPTTFLLLPPSGCCSSSLVSGCCLRELLHLELTILFMLLLHNLSKVEPDVEPARSRRRALAEQRSLVCDLKGGDHLSNEAASRAWRAPRRRPAAVPLVKLPPEMVLSSIVQAIGLAFLQRNFLLGRALREKEKPFGKSPLRERLEEILVRFRFRLSKRGWTTSTREDAHCRNKHTTERVFTFGFLL